MGYKRQHAPTQLDVMLLDNSEPIVSCHFSICQKKTTNLNLPGKQNAILINKSLSTVQIQRDLGVMINNNLSWYKSSNWRATKAMGVFSESSEIVRRNVLS